MSRASDAGARTRSAPPKPRIRSRRAARRRRKERAARPARLRHSTNTADRSLPGSWNRRVRYPCHVTGPTRRNSAYYSASVEGFLTPHPNEVLGILSAGHAHDLVVEQRQAWQQEIGILRGALVGFSGTVFLEFDVPRLGSRLDAALVSGP